MPNKTFKEALDEVCEELAKMSPEEFRALLDEHSDGDIAQILEHSGAFATLERQVMGENFEELTPDEKLIAHLTSMIRGATIYIEKAKASANAQGRMDVVRETEAWLAEAAAIMGKK